MNLRKFIEFFRTPTGRFLLFLIAGGVVLVGVRGCKNRAPSAAVQPRPATSSDFLAESARRLSVPFASPSKAAESKPLPPAAKTAVVDRLPPIRVYAAPFTESTEVPADYAPFGRLIRCKLVVTVDSANIATPIIGLVLEDVWHAGRLIIPAGAEVHGRAQLDRTRERIASQSTWTIVWHSGQELIVSGLALDHELQPDGSGWDIRDGSAGLRGELLKSDNLAELKLFGSAALSAVADAFQQSQQTPYGLQPLPTAKNAARSGAGQVLSVYAQQIYDEIERTRFARVPAGKQFYLYVMETLDLAKARVAGTRAHPETSASPTAAEERSPRPALAPSPFLRSQFNTSLKP